MSKVQDLAEMIAVAVTDIDTLMVDGMLDCGLFTNALEAAIDERINKQNPYDMVALTELIETNHQRLNEIDKRKA